MDKNKCQIDVETTHEGKKKGLFWWTSQEPGKPERLKKAWLESGMPQFHQL